MAVTRYVMVALLSAALCLGQGNGGSPSSISERLLAPWNGADHFPPAYRQSLDAFFAAEDAYRASDYTKASTILDALWAKHPAGSREWMLLGNFAQSVARSIRVNFGNPECYYALRMLTECVDWRLRARSVPGRNVHPIQLTVILIGKSVGIQPASLEQIKTHAGREVTHSLEPAVASGDEIIHESLFLFTEYIRAITEGGLEVKVKVARFPDLDVPVQVVENTLRVAGADRTTLSANLAPGAMEKIWNAAPETRSVTDWWWILYPSHVPEQYPEFARTEFITGGMAVGPDGRSPAFVIDDRWLLRSPPHLGGAPLTAEQRRAFLPQWFQHEFFHHLYRAYPRLELEKSGHQWFDRKTWPADFQGWIEPDYYAESLHKRLQTAQPPLAEALRYAKMNASK